MRLTPHVENLRREFLLAATALGEDAVEVAERLVAPLDASVRLTLLGVLSQAADEISQEMVPGSVDVRLRGIDPSFVVTAVPAEAPASPAGPAVDDLPPAVVEEEGATARINFRPPEQLKARIEEAASREGLSVNAWLVRFLSASLNGAVRSPVGPAADASRQYSGWVR
jgi:hypothetical protein